MQTHESVDEGQAMISTDTLRLLTGVGAIAAAAGIGVYLVVSAPRNTGAPDRSISPDVVLTAAQAGIDLSNGSPGEDADRLRAVFENGATTPANRITFRNGLYLLTESNEVFTGYLARAHDNGSPALVACVVDGTLQGPSVAWYQSGAIKRSLNHKDGAVVGQFIEYFENGELKLRAMASGQDSPSGGSDVAELTVGSYDEGVYERDQLGTGRLQLFTGNGSTTNSNTTTPLHEVNGWMLFHDSTFTGQKVYTTDSRSITQPG